MGLFYDPLQKKTKSWVFVVFVILPIMLIGLLIIFGGQYAKKNPTNEKELTPQEFFKKFDTKTK